MNSIFLIEEAWIDPMENRNADGYNIYGFVVDEEEAKRFCEKGGYWTGEDCWSVRYYPDGKMSKFRYKKVKKLLNYND